MASEDVKQRGEAAAVSTFVNLAGEAKAATEGVKSPRHALLSISKSLAAGGIAGGVSRTAVAPLERLKILLQVQNPHSIKYNGTVQGLKYIWQTEGFRGLFKGNGTNCARIVPNSAVKFFSYEQASKGILWLYQQQTGNENAELTPVLRLGAGACAGIIAMSATYPMDMVRGRLTVQTAKSPQQYRGIYHALTTVLREEGFRALYKGWLPSVIGVVPYVGLNFAVYESLKDWLIKEKTFGLVQDNELGVTTRLACGAVAGTIGQTVAYPLDVVRRRMQMVGCFDVEMMSWSTIRDITRDGGVLKKIITEGDGWATPKDGDEVSVKYEAKLENGMVHSNSESVQLHVGDGKLCPAIHKAVKTMRRNEKAELSVRFSYGFEVEFGREEAITSTRSSNITILLELLSWRSVVDVLGDKKILKKVISAGEGFVYPNEGSLVKVIYVGKREDGEIFELKGSNEEPFEYMCLEDQVEESLDKAIMTMKKGEKSQVLVFSDHVQGTPEASDTVFANPKVIYEVELLDFTKDKPVWKMDKQEKIEACEKKKQEGNALFKAGKFWLASKKYEKAVKCIEFNHNFSDEEKQQTKALLSSCNLNNAACKLKLEDYVGAATLCTKVLEIDQVNTKALFRRAQAYLHTSDLDKAEADSRRALTIDPNNRDIKLVYQMIKTKQKEHALYQAQLFGTMISKMN